jgi:hypothetical protein
MIENLDQDNLLFSAATILANGGGETNARRAEGNGDIFLRDFFIALV